jgi:sulfate adenylyltransferase
LGRICSYFEQRKLFNRVIYAAVDTTAINETFLISPCGGTLKDLFVSPQETADLKTYANTLPSVRLSPRAMCDLEMLASGAFSPLDRFMDRADYCRVLDEMRLAGGHVFPIPVTLTVENELREDTEIALRDAKNNIVAVMSVEETYPWDREEFCRKVLGTEDAAHPLVAEAGSWGKFNVSGRPRVIELPKHYDFPALRLSPRDVRARLETIGNRTVVAFQTRNPLHRAHEAMLKRALEQTGGVLLLHPAAGLTRAGDVDFYSRIRTYDVLTRKYFDGFEVLLALAPLAMRMAGPREALWHALIRRNYGANHFIVGRDHASPGRDSGGKPFYEPYAAQEFVARFGEELGVKILPFGEFVYMPEMESYEEVPETPDERKFFTLSGTAAREEYLNKGRPLPEWFMRPEAARILEETYPRRASRGFCVWFTGLSGAGKSTVAEILTVMLSAFGRRVSLLDGDIVRTNLSAGLGFDKKGRDANVSRIGFVAAEITRHNGVAVCAAISPYAETRAKVREMVGENFIEVFVDTPLEVCEQRDTKGLYAKARRGEIKDLTGIGDIYEPPLEPQITLDTVNRTAEENAQAIVNYLIENELLENVAQ